MGVGAGEDGRLDGRKKEGDLSTFIVVVVRRFLGGFSKEWSEASLEVLLSWES